MTRAKHRGDALGVRPGEGGSSPTCALQSDLFALEAESAPDSLPGVRCHQRVIRETVGRDPLRVKGPLYPLAELRKGFLFGRVPPTIGARFIERYEWLGDAGRTLIFYGLWKGTGTVVDLYGVEGFMPAPGVLHRVLLEHVPRPLQTRVLSRGACCLSAGKNAASMLIGASLRDLKKQSVGLVLAFADTAAGEKGIAYRAAGAQYGGRTEHAWDYYFFRGKWRTRNGIHRIAGLKAAEIPKNIPKRWDRSLKDRFFWILSEHVRTLPHSWEIGCAKS